MGVKFFLVLLLSLTLSSCGQTLYMKDGATPQEFQSDQFDCEQKVITMYGGYANMGPGHAIMARQDIHRCLTTKGYREATAEEYKQARLPSAPTKSR